MFEAALLNLISSGDSSSNTTSLPVVVTTYDTPCYGYPAYSGYPAYGYYYDTGYYYYDPYYTPYGYTYYPGYYYYPAMAEGGASQQLAALPPAPVLAEEGAEAAAVKANPGHLLTAAHALLLGGALATADLLSGKGDVADFGQNFQAKATAAADEMTPLGGYVLKEHVFQGK
jgi:hypothetical protein